MEINRIERKEKYMQLEKNDGQIINILFDELDELINLLYGLGYIKIHHNLKFNHYPNEVRLTGIVNPEYTSEML